MSEEETDTVSPITFTYEYAGHGWARAWIADGETSYFMDPSYVPREPLFDLVATLVEVLRYGGEAECEWFYEPAASRWILRRDGDRLHITIRWVRDGFTYPNWPTERDELRFSTTCDLWKFAHKVRLAVSRMEPTGEHDHDPSLVKRSAEYEALCAFLEEHKRTQRPPSTKTKR
jgi:hypothetical protein